MKNLFLELASHATALARGSEVVLLNFSAEDSTFIRFNRARVRQPIAVSQAFLDVTLIHGGRRDSTRLTLSGAIEADRGALGAAIDAMRRDIDALPVDPYLLYSTEAIVADTERRGRLPQAAEAIDDVLAAAGDVDLVGILASGPIHRGFASSLGSRQWHAVDSFLLDWSIYHAGDKAVKGSWGGSTWERAELLRRMASVREKVPLIARPPRTIEPGEYRAYLAPAALDELLSMLGWGGVSAKAQRTQQSAIQQLVHGDVALSPRIQLREDIAGGLAPAFDAAGFPRPPAVDLIRDGRHAGALTSARTAREYDIAPNGANDEEAMTSLHLAAGELAASDVLAALDTGIYVGNLWYLNWSDRSSCRITGMTRFATFWVENGHIVAPLNVMRFDDSLYRVLGTRLEHLTRDSEWILSGDTYQQRSVQTSRVPGALVAGLTLTL